MDIMTATKKLSDAIAYETLLKFCYRNDFIKCIEHHIFILNQNNMYKRVFSLIKRKKYLKVSGELKHYLKNNIERMKNNLKNITKGNNNYDINIIKLTIEIEVIRILKYYFYDIIKPNQYLYNEFENYHENKTIKKWDSFLSYDQEINDELFEASTSTATTTRSSISMEYFDSCPIKKIKTRDITLYYLSCEDTCSLSSIPSFKNTKSNRDSRNMKSNYHLIIDNMKDQNEFLKIKLYLCRYSFIKIIRLFKYFEKYLKL
ncbi:hypothetical protein BCR36DRAFT_363135 [Piromyces finnis]|uniref:Uncharacterized protein n=1 Tax=Piromyces finnis TaxID=1754191 RepID=A0A1Y1UVH6_9FUNG|nr:hypothetical protein BCR36DRAFT_417149 [Piromyces finnis]ORX42052.1 hypothetical protein BCR36DRAFT_363135 [Piromyces finnis]|eukprot:ORX36177.1 hypothetical protein BCR36DRAFT_417149 [Piromyces finnis]